MDKLDVLARQFCAFEAVDKYTYQRQFRVLQSLWREARGYAIGSHIGRDGPRPLGSRLPMPWARETLANFLSEPVRQVVREEVLDPLRSRDKLFGAPRIFEDLLSSQPLAFNLFATPSRDLSLASRFIAHLTQESGLRVTAIEFEWSPGRRDPRYTGDRSAFDVFVRYDDSQGRSCFLGIEVKYHEALVDKPALLRPRYHELATAAAWFRADAQPQLTTKPLQQIWRDHLLAASLLQARDFARGAFVVLHPGANTRCTSVLSDYRACLCNCNTFLTWTLEDAAVALKLAGAPELADSLVDRYLDLSKIDRAASRNAAIG